MECVKVTVPMPSNDEGARRTGTLYKFQTPPPPFLPNVTVTYNEPAKPPNQGYEPISGGPTYNPPREVFDHPFLTAY